MKIQSLRFGFATNSSSSHSVVILHDHVRDVKSNFEDGDDYGWNWFVLADPKAKMEYLATQMLQTFSSGSIDLDDDSNELNNKNQKETLKKILNISDSEAEEFVSLGRCVDHQSVWRVDWSAIDPDFVKDVKNFIQDYRVVILGGNDNSDDPDRQTEYGNPVDFFSEIKYLFLDHVKTLNYGNGVWSVFDTRSGNKFRLNFNLDNNETATKSPVPELVDLKITDYCAFGCKFCYQSSTKSGRHAPKEKIFEIIDKLAELGTFEIAIGGGEPTQHPDFLEIIKYTRSKNIVPNFTTFSLNWMKNADFSNQVDDYVGAVGLSIQTEKDFLKYSKYFPKNKARKFKFKLTIQHVLGASPVSETVKIIDFAAQNHVPILLLGYKDVGFGRSFEKYNYSELPFILKMKLRDQYRWLRLSMDSALLNEMPDIIKVLESPRELVVDASEGKFSMYIDAVEGKMAKSSYVEKDTMADLELSELLGFWRAL